jgi:hypothetical protein
MRRRYFPVSASQHIGDLLVAGVTAKRLQDSRRYTTRREQLSYIDSGVREQQSLGRAGKQAEQQRLPELLGPGLTPGPSTALLRRPAAQERSLQPFAHDLTRLTFCFLALTGGKSVVVSLAWRALGGR